jgi:hypothetical protein
MKTGLCIGKAAVLAVLAVLVIAGCDWLEGQPAVNLPPSTELLECPGGEVDEGEDLVFKWTGSDIDGTVIAYEWSLNGSDWVTTTDDSVVIEGAGEGEQYFTVRAVDNKGEVDPAPPRCDFTVLAAGELMDRVVLVEVFTTRTCANCPRAEEALNNLLDSMERADLAVVCYHDWREGIPASDPLGTAETVARIQWYTDDPTFPGRPSWWPTAVFDGLRIVEGAETVEQAESNYSVEIARRAQTGSPLRLTLAADLAGEEGSVQAGAKVMGRLPEGPLVYRCVIVEDHVLLYTSYYDFVARRVLEDRPLTVAAIGDSASAEWTFPIDDSWNTERVDVIVFVQNDDGREVLQSRRLKEQ